MVTRSHPGDSDRPLDGLPTLASGVVQPAAQPGGGRTQARHDAGKTLAALRGPPEDAVGLANIEIIETLWALRNYSQPGRRLRAGMEELKRTGE